MGKTKRSKLIYRKTFKQRGGNEKLVSAVNQVYDTIDFSNSNIHEEFKKLSKTFNEVLVPIMKEHEEKAKEYYEKREAYSKEVVDPVAKKAEDELKEILKEYDEKNVTYQVASSYSAKMNLIKESDVDFFILLKPMTDEKVEKLGKLLKQHNFKFEKVGSPGTVNAYHIFNKIVDDVEVEFKIRDFKASKGIRGLHKFLDHKLDRNLKILITYTKSVLKSSGNKDAYNKFKTIFFSVCFKDVEGAYYINV